MTKKELTQKVRDMLNDRPSGYVYTAEEQVTLDEFFSHHPNWETKQGCGIKHYYKGQGLNTPCYWIQRTDGSETEIGINKVLSRAWTKDAPTVILAEVRRACRHAVKPVIEQFRSTVVLPFVCIVSGTLVTKMEDVEVDHINDRFCDVFRGWWDGKTEEEKQAIKQAVRPSTDGCMEMFFTDQSIIDDFRAYHNSHTHLRAISKEANQTRGESTATIHRFFGGK